MNRPPQDSLPNNNKKKRNAIQDTYQCSSRLCVNSSYINQNSEHANSEHATSDHAALYNVTSEHATGEHANGEHAHNIRNNGKHAMSHTVSQDQATHAKNSSVHINLASKTCSATLKQ
jgi:hypothetical protein